MSYLEKYRTPRACYRKAPVRRETRRERTFRHMDMVPATRAHIILNRLEREGKLTDVTINRDLVPGAASHIVDVTR